MKGLIFYILVIGITNTVRSQDTTSIIDEGFLNSVVHIKIPQENVIGTGFLVSCNTPDKKYIITYLVTNKHMIGEYSLVEPFFGYDSIIVDLYSRVDNTPIPVTIKLLDHGQRKATVLLHPDSRIDVALINISDVFINNLSSGYQIAKKEL